MSKRTPLELQHTEGEYIETIEGAGDLYWHWFDKERRWGKRYRNTVRGKRKVQKPLVRYVHNIKSRKVAACDIETDGIGGKYLDGCIRLEDSSKHFHFPSVTRMLNFMAAHPKYDYYFHNGSGYDFTYFTPDLLRVIREKKGTIELVKQGASRIIGITVQCKWGWGQAGKFTMKDSLPLLNMSLKKAAEYFAPHMQKLDIGLAEGVTYDPHNPTHREYLHRDCDSLLAVMLSFYTLVGDTFGTTPGWTAGSTAMHAWKAHIPEGHVYWRNHKDVEKDVRNGYYGGFVYPGHDTLRHDNVASIDINAAYAAAMRKGVPVARAPYQTDEYEDMPGVWEVVAHVPHDIPYPCIPSRDRRGQMRWATGTFRTWITTEEIKFGQARGCTFDIVKGYVYRGMEYPFNEFLDKCERLELEQGGAIKQLIKIVRNSLYGKFGSKLEDSKVEMVQEYPEDDDTVRPLTDEITGIPVDNIIERLEANESNYVMPIWACYITMWQRLTLFELMEAVGIEHVFYCDTDSVKGDADDILRVIRDGIVSCDPGYGNVKVDERYEWFQCLGAKNYRGKLSDGDVVGKVKGIPKSALSTLAHFQAAHGIKTQVGFTSINGVLSRLKDEEKGTTTARVRTIGGMDHSASWVRNSDATVRPIRVDE